jgi:hypothetical protein
MHLLFSLRHSSSQGQCQLRQFECIRRRVTTASIGATTVRTRRRFSSSRTFSSDNRITGEQKEKWLLNQAIATVRHYDPAAFIPGYLLRDPKMRMSYFAMRAFWIETGLRFGSTAFVAPNSTPAQHVLWWQHGIHHTLFPSSPSSLSVAVAPIDVDLFQNHPVLQLLRLVQTEHNVNWTEQYFNNILNGRLKDLDVQQYSTVQDLIQHAGQSCGSLSQLLLESGNMDEATNPTAHRVANLVGIGHGLSSALRQSVAVLSTAGKLIVPADLTTKYNVKSPRYLLSALSSGDEACELALQQCVQEIVTLAEDHIAQARALRDDVLQEPNGSLAMSCFLSTIPSELFLRRLREHQYKLTDRNLRYTGIMDQCRNVTQIVSAYVQSKY